MNYQHAAVAKAAQELLSMAEQGKADEALKSKLLPELFAQIKDIEKDQRASFGSEVNQLKAELEAAADEQRAKAAELPPIDVTAPFDDNVEPSRQPKIGRSDEGSIHPIWQEINAMLDIYYRMGFTAEQSRQLDDDFHMFESLNFPADHPARDDYDTFVTEENLIAPAHTSTMQHRVLKKYAPDLEKDRPIAVVIPGRVFRNEDVDVTHEHTFYQLEGIYVAEGVNVSHLISTLQTFMSEYFGEELAAKTQPFYFPFTEPSFEFAIERPQALRKGDTEADRWLELLGCGMIHPNVLSSAGIDPATYSGFAWGGGVERLIMLKSGIEDLRHFHSASLAFLRQFS